jgi:hypothetical protein
VFLAEFTDAWLSVAGRGGGIWRVILIILQQSKIVLCVAVETGRIETAAAGIYDGAAGRYFAGGRAG